MTVYQNTIGYDEANRKLTALFKNHIDQKVELWNAATNNALVLKGLSGEGDLELATFLQNISDEAGYWRDLTSTADPDYADYAEGEEVAVKIAGGWAVKVPNAILMWQGGDMPSEVKKAYDGMAEQYAQYVAKTQLNTLITSMAEAFETEATATVDNSAGGAAIDQLQINKLVDLFGDAGNDFQVLIMHSGGKSGLVADGISNSNNLDTVGGVIINTGSVAAQGRLIISTDCPALSYHDGTRDVYKVLLLSSGAGVVTEITETSDLQNIQQHNIGSAFLANFQYTQGIKAWSWDKTIVNPTQAETATGANWTLISASIKNSAGGCLIVPKVSTP